MLRLKKAIAHVTWCSTTPDPVDDASHLTMNGLSKFGSCKTSVVDNSCFSYWNTKDVEPVHTNPSFFSS
jgi:hypothetical protein